MLFEVWGMNHRSAPLAIREKMSVPTEFLARELEALNIWGSFCESVIISTCNRFEVYTVRDVDSYAHAVPAFIAQRHGLLNSELSGCLYHFANEDAFRHLLKVITSLDSMVVGEAQIFGQVREAFLVSDHARFAGPVFKELFNEAFKTGREARSKTRIGKGAVSVSSLSMFNAARVLGPLENRTVMVIGAGEVGEHTVKHLLGRGIKDIIISNRTFEKACELARDFSLRAVRFENTIDGMKAVDLVITSTSSPNYIISKSDIERVIRSRPQRPLFLIDIAVPRDIDPDVAGLPNVHLCNIDDLDRMREINIQERLHEAVMVERLIEDKITAVMRTGIFRNPVGQKETATLWRAAYE
jgi:glutamyl-tRNA reductase